MVSAHVDDVHQAKSKLLSPYTPGKGQKYL